jgi:asparagine synthase (glutamine-hydrolysing)
VLQSVALHLRADVEVGVSLSGGVDSTLLVAITRKLLGPDARLPTFSYKAEVPEQSDAPWITTAERAIDVAPHHFSIDPECMADELESMLAFLCEPVESPSVFAQYRLFETARAAGVKVVLNGQGADELFAGYRGALPVRLAELVFEGRWDMFSDLAEAAEHVHRISRHVLLEEVYRLLPAPICMEFLKRFTVDDSRRQPDHLSDLGKYRRDLLHSGLPSLLRCEDRNAMAFGIESRVPFLTIPLAELALAIPSAALVATDGTMKLVLRRAFTDLLPPEIRNRRAKIGFASPAPGWVRALLPWAEQLADRHAADGTLAPLCRALRDRCAIARRDLAQHPDAAVLHFSDGIWRRANLLWWVTHHDVVLNAEVGEA